MTRKTRQTVIYGAMFSLVALSGQLSAQSTEFVPFKKFHEKTRSANINSLMPAGSRVREAKAFGEMRQHILSMYQDVNVTHSFVRNSSHFDCVPVEQQPTVRILSLDSVAAAPPQSLLAEPVVANDDSAELRTSPASQVVEQSADEFGNSVGCADRTIPIRRITLEEMTQFPTLQKFLEKRPDETAADPNTDIPAATPAASHKYAYMQQIVDNLGGNTNLNIWNPSVNTALGQVFSLSQAWYTGGSGASLQTVEVGWQNFPGKYGSQDPRLFIYWTADGYKTTGCYNLDCAAFVQIASVGTLGGGFANHSTAGGAQYEFSAKFLLYQGNWWLAVQGAWIGYYPASIFKGGQLTKHAQTIKFGTESTGTTVFPAEGSGNWAAAGANSAAYQRNLFYYNTAGTPLWDTLTPVNPSPACYSTAGPYSSTSSGWSVFFYAGGPGGSGC